MTNKSLNLYIFLSLLYLVNSIINPTLPIPINTLQSIKFVPIISQTYQLNQLMFKQLSAPPLALLNINSNQLYPSTIPINTYQTGNTNLPNIYFQYQNFPAFQPIFRVPGDTTIDYPIYPNVATPTALPYGTSASFSSAPSPPPQRITSPIYGLWNMTRNGQYLTRVAVNISQDKITFEYCNQHSYSYSIMDNIIKIIGGSSRRGICFYAPNQAKEHQIEASLLYSNFWQLKNQTLTLSDRNGEKVAQFIRK